MAFTHALYKTGQVTKKQYEFQVKYFQEFEFLEDCVMGFMITPEEAMTRENKHYGFHGTVMDGNFLSILHESYRKLIPNIQQKHHIINGLKSLEENGKEVLNIVSSL